MTAPRTEKRSIWSRLYHGETRIDFVGRFRLWATISLVVIGIGMVSLAVRGLNLGIDFEGGVVWEFPSGDTTVEEVRDELEADGLENLTVQTLDSAEGERIRAKAASIPNDEARETTEQLAQLSGTDVEDVSFTSVGPSWGEEISEKALRALVLFLVAITIYITLRFEWKMAIPTVVALLHDVLVTIGIYSLTGFEVTPATVVALLTILGFSIYDGIVVFDKVDENTRLVSSSTGLTYSAMVNLSLNQVLMRSLNTSITALLPVASLLIVGSYILGATTLQEFALALLIGLAAGAYSSIFIASPLLAVLKEREQRYRDLRRRIESRRGPVEEPISIDEAEVVAARAPASKASSPVPELSGRAIPPRPRKKGKRR